MTRLVRMREVLLLGALILAGVLGGCVGYPAYSVGPGYGYASHAPYYGGGWRSSGWHGDSGGGWHHGGRPHGWHAGGHGGGHGGGWRH
jgi:hypothetical protein